MVYLCEMRLSGWIATYWGYPFFVRLSQMSMICIWKEVIYLKKAISPIICTVLLIFVSRLNNPKIEVAGMLLLLFMGVAIGVVINNFIFREKKADNEGDR